MIFFFFSSRRRHTRFDCDWSSDVCSSDLTHHTYRKDAELEADSYAGAYARWAQDTGALPRVSLAEAGDRKSTRLNFSHSQISYAVFCLKKKKTKQTLTRMSSITIVELTHL